MDPAVTGDALWWGSGQVLAVGEASRIAARVPVGCPTFDLPDALVTPGFVDSHTHFAMWAMSRSQVQLAGAPSRAEALRRIAGVKSVDGWILGQGWDTNSWDLAPTRGALDEVQAGPVCLDSLDVHVLFLNSAAL